jgi:hypothetical protein
MKYLKMFGLAAILAMAFSAYLGAGSASATVLCTTKKSPCGAGWDEPAGTVVEASLIGSAIIEDTNGTKIDTCLAGTHKWEMTNTGGAGVAVGQKLLALTFGNCTGPAQAVTLGTEEEKYIEGSEKNGTMTDKGTEITESSGGVSCTYGTGTGTDIGQFDGGLEEKDVEEISAALTKTAGGILCSTSIKWKAQFQITKPKNITILDS